MGSERLKDEQEKSLQKERREVKGNELDRIRNNVEQAVIQRRSNVPNDRLRNGGTYEMESNGSANSRIAIVLPKPKERKNKITNTNNIVNNNNSQQQQQKQKPGA